MVSIHATCLNSHSLQWRSLPKISRAHLNILQGTISAASQDLPLSRKISHSLELERQHCPSMTFIISIVRAVMSLDAIATVAIITFGRTGEGFASLAGVKQGCPLSPTLFGLLLDGLQRYLLINCAGIGPKVSNGNIVPVLMYADHITFMATLASELQKLINVTSAFCKAVGFTISAEMSSVCVFSRLPQCGGFRYFQ